MFVETKTKARGAAWLLLALAGLNVIDMREDPALFARVEELLSATSPPGFVYGRETPDVWTSVAVDVWRANEQAAGRVGARSRLEESRFCAVLRGQTGDVAQTRKPIRIDCEDIAATIAAWAWVSGRYRSVRVCVTQPLGKGVCHAYNELDGQIVDGAAIYGMRNKRGQPPPLSWYRQPATAMFDLFEPTPSFTASMV